MGWLNPLSPLAPITDPLVGFAVQIYAKLGTHTGYLSTQINQCGHFLHIYYHWGLLRMSHQKSDGVRVEKRNRGNLWSSFLLCCFQDGHFWFRSGRECWEPTVGCCSWCWCGVRPHSLSPPPDWIKVFAWVVHS